MPAIHGLRLDSSRQVCTACVLFRAAERPADTVKLWQSFPRAALRQLATRRVADEVDHYEDGDRNAEDPSNEVFAQSIFS
jgi:hypothetical protein